MAFARRQTSSTDEFLNLIANPFQSQLQAKAIYASLVWSFLVAGVLFLTFCLLRPRVPTVYAPRAKYADERHAPPPLGPSPLAWTASLRVREDDLADKIGLDAVVFLRFLRMLRNIFLVLTLIGLIILVPVNVAGGHQEYSQWPDVATLMKITPQYIHGGTKFWAFTLCAYIFQGTVCGFVWWNYRAVLRLKRAYFASQEYRASLHARTILLTHLPQHARTDQGIAQLVEGVVPIPEVPTTTVGRNVKDLPDLIEQHEEAVYKLEEHLAKYLKDPNRLPPTRPTCKVAKRDRARYGEAPVDAINYLTERITTLTEEIREVRESIDRRNPMPYGFASYTHIEDAHAVAYAARKKGPEGSDVNLAPKPHDILWQNLGMTRKTRRTRVLMDGFWMVILTILFIVPNILTAVFLSDFSHLGLVWPAFNANLQAHSTAWGVAQGIIAPLVQILMYLALPPIFRRLYTHSGDVSKTMRDRHVTVRLYAFFVFNNLIVFSVFGSAWKFVASVVKAKNTGVWHAIEDSHPFVNLVIGLCNMSTFWFTWQMQRNLLAAADLLQAWPLIWGSFRRKYTSPTPRELIKFTAPQPFDYAGYYNNFLFVATVGLCYATLQPLILPITAFYMVIEVWWKKYMLQYICITKIESGGVSWKLLVNRLLFATLLANAVIALVVGANGIGSIQSIDTIQNGGMLYTMIPLPFLLWGFKWYTARTFDEKIQYFSTRPYAHSEAGPSTLPGTPPPKRRSSERVALRFGHPGLYKPLITPMINSKAQHLLPELYRGPLSPQGPASPSTTLASPYTDSFPLSPMDPANRGKAAPHGTHPYPSYEQQQQRERELDSKHEPPNRPPLLPSLSYETVHSPAMSFDNFKHRPEFRDDYGGDGELYGRPDDWVAPPYNDGKSFGSGNYARSASPHSSVGSSAPGSPRVGAAMGYRPGSQSPGRSPRRRPVGGDEEETVYAQGYHRPSAVAGMAADSQEDLRAPLAGRAAGMGRSEPARAGFGFGDSSYEELRTGRRR